MSSLERKTSREPCRQPSAEECSAPPDRLRPLLLCGMTALFVVRPLFPSESAAFFGDGLTVVMLWIALAVFWILGSLGRPTSSIRFGWIDAAVLILIGWIGVASLWATRHGTPRPAVNMLWEWIGLGLCFLLARQLLVTPREARAAVVVMVALAAGLSGYGVYQRFYELPQTQASYAADPDRVLRDAGLWFPPGSRERDLFECRLGNREPLAAFALTNSLAAFLTPWLIVLAGIAYNVRRDRKRLLRVGLPLILIALCLLLTKSRSGYIAACAGLVLVWLFCREKPVRIGWKLPAAAGGIAAVLLAVALSIEGPQLFDKALYSFSFRIHYWRATAQMIGDHWLLGCGPGNFQNTYTQYKLPQAHEEVADPHNFLLEIAATAGLPAAVAFLGVLACFFGATRRCETEKEGRPEPSSDGSAYVLVGGLAGFLLSVPMGLLSAAPPGAASVLLGLPLAIATIALLRGWVEDGRLPRLLPAVGVAVLLIDLLTTGGIAFPGVAGTLWLLLALGLVGQRPRAMPAVVAWPAFFILLALAVACYQTAYSPVLGCQAKLRMALREPTRSVEYLADAAAADPLSAEPWQQLAAIEFDAWQREPSKESFERFETANAHILGLAPNAAPAWLAAGDWYLQAYSQMKPRNEIAANDALDKAIYAYRRAVELYPNSKQYREKLAEACRAAGDQPGMARPASQTDVNQSSTLPAAP